MSGYVENPRLPMPNARIFLSDQYGIDGIPEAYRLRSSGGLLRGWSGGAWRVMTHEDLEAEVYAYFEYAVYLVIQNNQTPRDEPFNPNNSSVGEIVAAVKAITHDGDGGPMPYWLDPEPPYASWYPAREMLPMANGLLHAPRRVLLPHTPMFMCPYTLPYSYVPDAPEPVRFLRFLDELWPDDIESQQLLQEFIGYLLTPDTSYQKMLLIYGLLRSGKGTLGRLIRRLVGRMNAAGPTLASLRSNFGLWPLIDKPVAIIPDARLDGKTNAAVVERLLSISGEDALTIDIKYRQPVTTILPTRIVILTNELPRLDDASGALASRFLILKTTKSFLGKEDRTLDDQLARELPGVLLWALDGLDRLRVRGHFVEPSSSMAAMKELADLASPIRAFVRETCVTGQGHEVAVDDLFSAWMGWSEDRGVSTGRKQEFGRDLHSAVSGIEVRQHRLDGGDRRRYYIGIGLSRSGTQ